MLESSEELLLCDMLGALRHPMPFGHQDFPPHFRNFAHPDDYKITSQAIAPEYLYHTQMGRHNRLIFRISFRTNSPHRYASMSFVVDTGAPKHMYLVNSSTMSIIQNATPLTLLCQCEKAFQDFRESDDTVSSLRVLRPKDTSGGTMYVLQTQLFRGRGLDSSEFWYALPFTLDNGTWGEPVLIKSVVKPTPSKLKGRRQVQPFYEVGILTPPAQTVS